MESIYRDCHQHWMGHHNVESNRNANIWRWLRRYDGDDNIEERRWRWSE